MSNLNKFLTFECQNEHVLEHDLPVKKNFSAPKIYNANGDLKKRWYLYYSYLNPQTGKLQRMKNIYGTCNSYKTKEDRLSVLTQYRKKLLSILQEGYNPYEDNTYLYDKRLNPERVPERVPEIPVVVVEDPKMTLKEAFDLALKLKEKQINPKTKFNYQNRIDNLLKWTTANRPEMQFIDELGKKDVINFLNEELLRTSARSRNNFRVDLSSLMQTLEDNEIIALNFVKKIPVLKSIPERNKTYTTEKQEEIFTHLEKTDPILLLFIKFISYNFLRPIEVCRLKVGDLNLVNNTIQFKAKNSNFKTKIIPEILLNDLPDLSGLDKNLFLFTPDKVAGEWSTEISNKRDYFSKRFKSVVKDHFHLGVDYGLYSFRHTFITKLYRDFAKTKTPYEAKSKLMLITGHASMDILDRYLREIDAELPEDYSKSLQ